MSLEQPPVPQESAAERENRFREGTLTEAEIKEHWRDPSKPLFEHEIAKTGKDGQEMHTKFAVRAFTEEYKEELFKAVEKSWAASSDFEELKETVESFFEQQKLPHPPSLNVEYYVATNDQGEPFAMTGIYTLDMEGQGFALNGQLDPKEHYMNMGLGWFAVSPEYQSAGVGRFLSEWIEKMAAARGGKRMVIQTDDTDDTAPARAIYERSGSASGFNIKDYFGPGRDLNTYYRYHPEAQWRAEEKTREAFSERITAENKAEVLELGKKIYSPLRYKEFEAALNLLLLQKPDENTIEHPEGFVHLGQDGHIESFAIIANAIYENMTTTYWHGYEKNDAAREKLLDSLTAHAVAADREVNVIMMEGENQELAGSDYVSPEKGIPFVYGKGDETQFVLYSKVIS
jgi:GNAT superfamily N-acetyltransferase